MACAITKGRNLPCKSVGGIKDIFFVPYNANIYPGITTDAGGKTITDWGSAVVGSQYEIKGTNSIEEVTEVSRDNMTSFVTVNGTVQLRGLDTETHVEMEALNHGRHIVVASDFDNVYTVYGLEDGCEISVNTTTGAAMGEFRGYTVTITALQRDLAYFASSTSTNWSVNGTNIAL